MKNRVLKIVLRSALITLGLLCLCYGLFQPLVYRFGRTATAVCDEVDAVQLAGNNYTYSVNYHYFIDGTSYSGAVAFTGDFDEFLSEKATYPVRYFPLLPSSGILDLHYQISKESFLFAALGAIAFVLGLMLHTRPKKASLKAAASPKKAVKKPSGFFCPACGKALDSDSIFCNHCGRKLL